MEYIQLCGHESRNTKGNQFVASHIGEVDKIKLIC